MLQVWDLASTPVPTSLLASSRRYYCMNTEYTQAPGLGWEP